MYHVVTTENEKTELTPLPTPKWQAPVQVSLDDDNLPD